MALSAGDATGASAPAAGERTTLVEHFWRQVRDRSDRPAMHFRVGDRWAPITWRQFGAASRRLAGLLLDEGVEAGDHVAIWAGNRPEWHIADAAVLSVRARPVPVYLSLSAEQVAYVLGHSGAVVAFVETTALLEKLVSVRDRLPRLRRVVVMNGLEAAATGAGAGGDGFAVAWSDALDRGDAAARRRGADIDARIAAVEPDDVATLIYTSGTTGPPKAVMITHGNVAAGVASVRGVITADADDRILSYLPLAHVAERMSSEFRSYVFGNATWFAESIEKLPEHLADVRPTLFFAVPRIWEKMATRIRAGVESAAGPRGRLARWAVRTGERVVDVRAAGHTPSALLIRRHRLADRLVLSRIRAALGLDDAILASGAAPIDPGVLRFLAALGMEVLEVYGQTEGSGLCSMNRPGRARIGTVGEVMPGVEVRIESDGEILVRSGAVFRGYHSDDAATAEALDADGWLRTGDIGELDADGYLRITDRKKDLIITAGGKNIAPSNIETALTRHPLIGNAVAIGDRRPYVAALLTLDTGEAEPWARRHGLDAAVAGDAGSLSRHAAVRAEVQRHVDSVNAGLSKVEAVKRWAMLAAPFTVGEELTPTLKVRRKVVAERHAAAIEALYDAGRGPAVTNV